MLPDRAKPVLNFAKTSKQKSIAPKPARSQTETVRRWIVRLIFIVYWLLIFEGVLRKWALPGLHKALFFIRDPFVLITYFLAFKYGLWPRWSAIFSTAAILGGLFMLLALTQALTMDLSPVIVLYGWRNYFLYIPFAFIIGEQFRGKDLFRLLRYTLLVSIPVAILCYQQFRAPAESSLNEAFNGSAPMMVANGIVRTSGTFTVSAAQTLYIGSLFAMLYTVWLLPRSQRPLNRFELWAATFSTLATFAVSGARSVFVYAAIVTVFAFASAFVAGGRKFRTRTIIAVPLLVILGTVCYVKLFPEAFKAMVSRQSDASMQEGSTIGRLASSTTTIIRILPRMSLLGAGLGSGTNAANVLRSGQMGLLLAEDESQRIILETGIFGLLYVGYRYWLTVSIGRDAFRAGRRSHNPLPIIFFGYEVINLAIGQMTLQGTINGYGWLFAGFCLAANRLGLRDAKALTGKAKGNTQDLWT
jgi:hypothetical protein